MFLYKKFAQVGRAIFPVLPKFLMMVAALSIQTEVSAKASSVKSNKHAQPARQAARNTLITQDDHFLALRDAALHDDPKAAQAHAAALSDYDIPSYVEYFSLRSRIVAASNNEIKAFLNKYEGSAIADRMRNDWLLLLGRRADWSNFDAQYPLFVLADDTQLKCYALLSKALKQQKVDNEARALLSVPREYGDGCYSMVTYLYENGQLNAKDLWGQMQIAGEISATSMAVKIGKLLGIAEKEIKQVMEKPEILLKTLLDKRPWARELRILALGRMAKSNPEQAVASLSNFSLHITDAEKAQAWAQIALPVAQKLRPEALTYWRYAEGAKLSQEGYQWRVRSALREGHWRFVKAFIADMPPELRKEPAWIYWYGRALMDEGKIDDAQAQFASIAEQQHFYGQLALEERGLKIGLPVMGKPVTDDEVALIANNPNLLRALRFYRLNLRLEGTREWNWELRKMNERQHLVAAELARRNELLDRMVNTSDRTRTEIDFNQRFPTPFNDSMYKTTQALGLDMAWVYGLIRQESRFISSARSHVGANGLMQIMPATARYVAKRIGLGKFVPEQVNDVDTNIVLGTNYLNMVLTDLGGSQALASAAYNAGPGRPRAWRSTLTRPVEGAIFAETIPFTETRAYVKNVLSNATYYAALLEKKPQSLKMRLGVVTPKINTGSDLDALQESN